MEIVFFAHFRLVLIIEFDFVISDGCDFFSHIWVKKCDALHLRANFLVLIIKCDSKYDFFCCFLLFAGHVISKSHGLLHEVRVIDGLVVCMQSTRVLVYYF